MEDITRQEQQDIFVRAHSRVRTKDSLDRRWSPAWPEQCLIFDTETTLDPAQKLNFGVYRRCKLVGHKYLCVEEGIFYREDATPTVLKILERYRRSERAEIHHFPSKTTLGLMTLASFVSRVFFKSIRDGDLIVGFNLPFDLSRLATTSNAGTKSDWSLAFTRLWKNPKTGRIAPNPNRPRIVIDAQNSKMAFMKLGSIARKDEWPNEGRFLDLRTLGWALRNVSYNLQGACQAFKVIGKVDHKPSGQTSPKEIDYCRGDVGASFRLLNAMMVEFNRNPVDLKPDKAYSSASIAKAYLREMGIKQPKQHFKLSNKTLGIAMQSYYGGRAECRIRKTPVPVIHTDFTSQYPTVNALLGNWNVLTSSSLRLVNCTSSARKLIAQTALESTFEPDFWKKLSFFALVEPKADILPIRTVYNTGKNQRTQNIGLNYLNSQKPIWYAAPDLIASRILTGKAPKILKALRMLPVGRQNNLKTTNLGGMVGIKPGEEDFFRKVIEQRVPHKKQNPALANFLKIVANSGSYGLFVEVNKETKKKEKTVRYFSGEEKGTVSSNYVEKAGAWYFPPLASLIISGGRLLLAMLEKSVQERKGSYLFCDTDSLCIVGSRKGGFVECAGGSVSRKRKSGIKSLSLNDVKAIARKFNKLNPYDEALVPEVLKIEDVNFVDSDPQKPFRQLFGYAISAKRYALYSQSGNGIRIEKASGHGLGYLCAPKERQSEEDDDQETPMWVMEAWHFLLSKELKLRAEEPPWLDLPAMMRMVVTTPNVFKHKRPEWLGPFNFFLFPLLSEEFGGYPAGFDKSNFVFITPYESNRKKWKSLKGVNLEDGQRYEIAMRPTPNQDKVIPDSFRTILKQYLGKPEVKSLAPDGAPCLGTTRGILRRATIKAGKIVPVGKETDRRWEQGEDPSMIDSGVYTYEEMAKTVVADLVERKRLAEIGIRPLKRESKLSQAPISNAIHGIPIKLRTLAVIRQAAARISPK